MSELDFWHNWAIDLDDAAFANAWAALGVAAAAGRRGGVPRDVLARVLERSVRSEHQVAWKFPPSPTATPQKTTASALIAGTTPREWAQAWIETVRPRENTSPPRLRVVSAPGDEPALPWLRVLGEARPAPDAVSFRVVAARPQCHVAWPLRLGFLTGNASQALIERAREQWPSREQSVAVGLGREEANCDVLVHVGTIRTLLQALLDHRVNVKADVVVLIGGDAGDWGEVSSRLGAILGEVRGSGYALVAGGASDDDLAIALNRVIEEISHARPFDVAFSRAFTDLPPDSHGIDVVAGYTDELAAITLPRLAHRMNRRMKRMPRGSALDLSTLGGRDEWLTRGVRGGGQPGGVRMEAAAAPGADRYVEARSVEIEPAELGFDHERQGAAVLATVAGAIEHASIPERVQARRVARFFQQQSFVRREDGFVPATNGFVTDLPALVRVRIGPPEARWNALPAEFPVEKLPPELERWNLTVWMTEPDHLQRPLKGRITLPTDGPSTECEFLFRPAASSRFEARITVLHRGRVIQTAVLRASVRPAFAGDAEGRAPTLEDVVPVRQGLGNLKERRQFDLAFVLNHDAGGRPLSTGLSEQHAWVSDLRQSIAIAQEINARLSPVAKSVADYANGLDGEKGRALLVQLAQQGCWLHLHLVEEQLGATGNRAELATQEYLQIVSTRSDAVIPFEFIYDYQAPDDDARLCEHWRQGVEDGSCRGDCDHTSGKRVCPMGFWGIQKVIERHALTPELAREGRELYLQSEPTRVSDTLKLGGGGLFGASTRVPAESLAPLTATLTMRTGTAPGQATDWDNWAELVRTKQPSLLLALAHTDGKGSNVSLEVGGKTIKSIQIKPAHVRSDDASQRPLVALLGCDTVSCADDYGNHVAVFRQRGAAIVIGTIATVFGEHAAVVAKQLVESLLQEAGAPPQRLGEALRALKRRALLDNLLMPLCLVAYGDADWKLTR